MIYTPEEWKSVLEEGVSDTELLRNSLKLGVPKHLRGEIWAYLVKASRYTSHYHPMTYFNLLSIRDPKVESAIQKDINRTLPLHDMFSEQNGYGQTGLFNILKSYASLDPSTGYCQEMSFIAAYLLMNMLTEELAFWAFVEVMFQKNWREVLSSDLSKFKAMVTEFERTLEERLPRVKAHFKKENLSCYVFQPFLTTICTYNVPEDLATRVMDWFLLDGENVVYSFLVSVLKVSEHKILNMSGEELYKYLRKQVVLDALEEAGIDSILSSC
mmetsp:Transcript_6308/g.9365  ORF Transcript_6308/g.9365 Transcript_6308/m.9365 type:complete len:271 (-) Transcript_6308:1547-2359(-)